MVFFLHPNPPEFYRALKIKFDAGLSRENVLYDLDFLPTWTLLENANGLELVSERRLVETSIVIHNPVIGLVKLLESAKGVDLCPPTYELHLPDIYGHHLRDSRPIEVTSWRQRIWPQDSRVLISVHRQESSHPPIDLDFVFYGILVALSSFLAAAQPCFDDYRASTLLKEKHSSPVAHSHNTIIKSPALVFVEVWRQYPQLEIYAPSPAPVPVKISRGYPHFDIYPVWAPATAVVDVAFKDGGMTPHKPVAEPLKSVKVSVWSQYPHLEIYGPRIAPITLNIAQGYPVFDIYPSCMESSIPTSSDSDERRSEKSDTATNEIHLLIWEGYPNFVIYPPHTAPVSVKIGSGYPQFDIYPVWAPTAAVVDVAFNDGGMATNKHVTEPFKNIKVSVWSQYPDLEIYGPRISPIIVDIGRGYPDYSIYPAPENSIPTLNKSDGGSLEKSENPIDKIPILIWQGYPTFVIYPPYAAPVLVEIGRGYPDFEIYPVASTAIDDGSSAPVNMKEDRQSRLEALPSSDKSNQPCGEEAIRRGGIIIPGSVRPDGSVRKPIRVRTVQVRFGGNRQRGFEPRPFEALKRVSAANPLLEARGSEIPDNKVAEDILGNPAEVTRSEKDDKIKADDGSSPRSGTTDTPSLSDASSEHSDMTIPPFTLFCRGESPILDKEVMFTGIEAKLDNALAISLDDTSPIGKEANESPADQCFSIPGQGPSARADTSSKITKELPTIATTDKKAHPVPLRRHAIEMESMWTRDESGLFSDEDVTAPPVIKIGKRFPNAPRPIPIPPPPEEGTEPPPFVPDPLETTTKEIPMLWGTNDGLFASKRGNRGKNGEKEIRKVSEAFREKNKSGFVMVRTPSMPKRVKCEIGRPLAQELYDHLLVKAGLPVATGSKVAGPSDGPKETKDPKEDSA
ncbi:hypothetical protein FRC03_005943 [Tulasnella sp. 419]|nr:hypothetical protein FRC03_005943 [Tulasnella sp. 419]